MKYLLTFILAACINTIAFARGPVEKIEQRFPENIGKFERIKRTAAPETNRVKFVYKLPDRASAILTITALHPTRDGVDIEAEFDKAIAAYAKSEPSSTVTKLPDFPESLIGRGCGPQFRQLNFRSEDPVFSYVSNQFATVFDRHVIRISVLQEEKYANQQLEVQFLNHIRAALGDCK